VSHQGESMTRHMGVKRVLLNVREEKYKRE
jgi:hypothetical protein